MNRKDDVRKKQESEHHKKSAIDPREEQPGKSDGSDAAQKKTYYLLSNFKSMKPSAMRNAELQSLPQANAPGFLKKVDKPTHTLNNKSPDAHDSRNLDINVAVRKPRPSAKAIAFSQIPSPNIQQDPTPQISPKDTLKKNTYASKNSPGEQGDFSQMQAKSKFSQHISIGQSSAISTGLKQLLAGTSLVQEDHMQEVGCDAKIANYIENGALNLSLISSGYQAAQNISKKHDPTNIPIVSHRNSLSNLKQGIPSIRPGVSAFLSVLKSKSNLKADQSAADKNGTFNSLVTHPDACESSFYKCHQEVGKIHSETKPDTRNLRPSKKDSKRSLSSDEKNSASSDRKSDEKLCRAFSVERSFAITAKAKSANLSESFDNDPNVERSMRLEESRTLSFLNEDEETLEKLHEKSKLALKKNKLKNSSLKFSINKKLSLCENKTPVNPLLNVISSISGAKTHQPSMYSPDVPRISGKLNPKDGSMFSTQDSRPGQNRSQNNQDAGGLREVFSEQKPESLVSDQQAFPVVAVFEPGLPEDRKKPRTRKCQPVTDSQSFDICVDQVYDSGKTTLMIKNIPNRYTKEMMLETIDKKFKDAYDFFYLPIDFDNNCNVGYAFINFVDLRYIEGFHNEFNGTHWSNFKSDKICEITYARIQGKDDCNQHFKDSSLMKQEVS